MKPTVPDIEQMRARLDAMTTDRRQFGLTTQQAADILGVSRRCWQRWESMDRIPSPQMYDLWRRKTARRKRVSP